MGDSLGGAELFALFLFYAPLFYFVIIDMTYKYICFFSM